MPILEAAAANVESTLAFMLSSKIVEIVGDLRGSQGSDPRDSTLFLCIGILFLSAAPVFLSAPSPPTAGRKTGMLASAARVGRDMLSLASEVLLLAFSRLVMQQVRLSKFVVDPVTAVQAAVFQYAQRIAEILFVGIVLACSLTTFLPTIEKQRGGIVQRVQTGPLLGKQLNSVVLNIQRTFADTVASIIPDVQTRRMVVLLGLCMLPSIASVVSGSSSISMQQIEAFFLLQQRTGKSRDWHPYARLLLKICVTGLSMAWINTALGFIMPSLDPSSQADALDVWISLVSTLCLAILMQSLHPMFPGDPALAARHVCFLNVLTVEPLQGSTSSRATSSGASRATRWATSPTARAPAGGWGPSRCLCAPGWASTA